MSTTITLTLPLPPRELAENGKNRNWGTRNRIFKRHRTLAFATVRETHAAVPTWPQAVMHVDWFQIKAGGGTDDDNALQRCAAYRDGVAATGLVEDDNQIVIGTVTMHRVKTKAEQRVVLRFERAEQEAAA